MKRNPVEVLPPGPDAAARACAAFISQTLVEAVAQRGWAALAISGGSTPLLMFRHLLESPIAWALIHLFWTDERAVPPDHPDSNFRMANEELIRPAGIPEPNVHRIRGELDPVQAAGLYESEIRTVFGLREGELPRFDVMHFGMGHDTHTASLFPGEPLIADRERIAAAVYVPSKARWRITLLPGVILTARACAVLAVGEDKAEAVRAVFQAPLDPLKHPAQLVSRIRQDVMWFLDDAAAGSTLRG